MSGGMPRPKVYKTKEARRLAICQKSQQYYHRSVDAIRAKKRQKCLQVETSERDLKYRSSDKCNGQAAGELTALGAMSTGVEYGAGIADVIASLHKVQYQYRKLTNL
ncbi:hypothetical protein V5O48_015828 [Marasmius crinis-equi]|uniref:Uncharacterized protein n=1 Tax=Marasmius crinis-equi TaxID=585013 RepID=A0ABR3ETE2_9AGAR